MALGLLFFMLLGALTTHAQESSKSLSLEPLPNQLPVQPNFQDTLFQGKWYALAHGENWFPKKKLRKMNIYSVFFDLNHDHSFNVTTVLFSGSSCEPWPKTLIPSARPGVYNLAYVPKILELRRYTEQIVSTNYQEFAILYKEYDFTTTVNFIIHLYGRTTTVSSAVKDEFYRLVKAQGAPENNIIFYEQKEDCNSQLYLNRP